MGWSNNTNRSDRRPRWKRRIDGGFCAISLCLDKLRRPHHVMCPHHWRQVPPEIRSRVWSALFGGTNREFELAVEAAINSIKR